MSVDWGRVTHALGILSSSYFPLLLEESLLRIVEVYSDMLAVQLDDVYQTLLSVDIFTIIVHQELLGDVVDQLHEGYNGKILFLD